VKLVQFFEDVVALVCIAGLLERGEIFTAPVGFTGVANSVAIDEHGQVLALDAQCLRVQDQDALDNHGPNPPIGRGPESINFL
jgi:hypothetical protein